MRAPTDSSTCLLVLSAVAVLAAMPVVGVAPAPWCARGVYAADEPLGKQLLFEIPVTCILIPVSYSVPQRWCQPCGFT